MAVAASETERLRSCLAKLSPHLNRDEIALTGGVAIELTLAGCGLPGHRDTIADLDFVARRREAIASSLAEEFLVCHYHMPQAGYPKFLVMVVDPGSRIRVDIFSDLEGAVQKAKRVVVGDERLLMLDPDSLLDHKLRTLAKASEANPVDEKHHRDALALERLRGRAVPPVPALYLTKDVYSTDLAARCPRCEFSRDPAFPLAPKQRILDLLGYV